MLHITESLINLVSEKAQKSERKRSIQNFHKSYDDTLQRMVNAMEPATYCPPHKHESPDKREVFLILRGSAVVVEYDNDGNITDHSILNYNNGNYAVEISERTWHSIIALEPGTVVYEFKDGPYNPLEDKILPTWAPAENTSGTLEFNKKVLKQLGILSLHIK